MSELTKVCKPRIKVPADRVRTREVILAALPDNAILYRGLVWVTCYSCGGRGTYPSACLPPGMCRLYCWANRSATIPDCLPGHFQHKSPDDPTYGRLPWTVDKYVKKCQASDRAEYRAAVQYELDTPAREARQAEYARQEAERQAELERQRADEAARIAVSQWVGTIGEKINMPVTLVDHRSFDSQYGRRSMYRFRDDAGNVLVWWTTSGIDAPLGERMTIKATIKEHGEYKGERQTILLRATPYDMPGRISGREMTNYERSIVGLPKR